MEKEHNYTDFGRRVHGYVCKLYSKCNAGVSGDSYIFQLHWLKVGAVL